METKDIKKQIKMEASRIMHLHFLENDEDEVIKIFGDDFSWIGTSEEEYAYHKKEAIQKFLALKGSVPRHKISDEVYDVEEIAPNIFVCVGKLWITKDSVESLGLRIHKRVTFVFEWEKDHVQCLHIHCSNPCMEIPEMEESLNEKGELSYSFIKNSLVALEKEVMMKNHQLKLIMSSLSGGLAIIKVEEGFPFSYVSEEVAELFGYSVPEFMEATKGLSMNMIESDRLEQTLQNVRNSYNLEKGEFTYRIHIIDKNKKKKWLLLSGKKVEDAKGDKYINVIFLDVTYSESITEEMNKQNELLASIFQTLLCGVTRFKRNEGEFELTSINPAAISMLGFNEDDVLSWNWERGLADTLLEEDRIVLENMYAKLNKVGDTENFVCRIQAPEKEIRWLKGASIVVDEKEGAQIIQCLFFDVTESKNLEFQLRKERELYKIAMESSGDVVFEYTIPTDTWVTYTPVKDADGNFIKRSEFCCYRELVDKGDFIYHLDKQLVIDNICEGRSETFECRLISPNKSGEYWWYKIDTKLLKKAGKPERVVGTIRDIHTEKKLLNIDMDEYAMQQAALQTISGAYFSIYYANLCKDWFYAVRLPNTNMNIQFERSGSVKQESVKYIHELLADDVQEKAFMFANKTYLNEVLKTVGDRISFESATKGDVEFKWLRFEVYLLSKKEDKIENVIMTVKDITKERARELERQAKRQEARKVLEESYESARSANLAKSDFLSRMSHDIRTPMNAVLGMISIAKRNIGNPDKLEDCLNKIRLSSEHLLNLINEVLDMSKIESGENKKNDTVFNIRDVVFNSIDMLFSEMERKNQRFSLKIEDMEHENVLADRMHLQQILLNLLSNAIKYTQEEGKIELSISEHFTSVSGIGCFQIIIQDNGMGMSKDFIDRIFEPFERAEDTRVSRIQGTGLGMTITKNLVNMMDGTIEVESELNVGSKFIVTLYLPISQQEISLEEDMEEESIEFSCHDWTVLLVEDNDLNREIEKELLEMEGIHVEEAMNGEEAIRIFESKPLYYYDLIIMDIQMPVMNGYEACTRIRKMKRKDAQEMPIVALSANAFADDVYAAKNAGMNKHLTKPFDIHKMVQVLHELLDGKEG